MTLRRFLTARLETLNWQPADFHRALDQAGLHLSLQAVCLWLNGGGIADKHKPTVARVLSVPLADLTLAAAGEEAGDPLAMTG
jgi:hypothetical protein